MEESRYFELDAKLESLRIRKAAEDPRILAAYGDKVDIGWLYHDNALEGVVLTYGEIRDALDRKIELHKTKGTVLDKIFKSLLQKLMTGKVRIDGLDLMPLQAPVYEPEAAA